VSLWSKCLRLIWARSYPFNEKTRRLGRAVRSDAEFKVSSRGDIRSHYGRRSYLAGNEGGRYNGPGMDWALYRTPSNIGYRRDPD